MRELRFRDYCLRSHVYFKVELRPDIDLSGLMTVLMVPDISGVDREGGGKALLVDFLADLSCLQVARISGL